MTEQPREIQKSLGPAIGVNQTHQPAYTWPYLLLHLALAVLGMVLLSY